MKTLYLSLLVLFLASCGQPKESTSTENATEAPDDYTQLEAFLGSWSDEQSASDIITIRKINNFDSAKVCLVNDGKAEVAFPYVVSENKFKLRQPEYWVEILLEKEKNQLLWKVTRFDEADGKVVRKYNFKSK